MTSGLLLAWAVMAGAMANAATPATAYPRLDDIRDHMRYPGLEVTVEWVPCGTPNAFYIPRTRTVRMCTELLPTHPPGVIRFFFAHEMAHALIHQLEVPFTYSEEAAADELAAVILVLSNNAEDVSDAADWFATKHMEGWVVHPLIDHPDHLKRAVVLKCLSMGREAPPQCPRDWNRAVWTWGRLLPEWED